MSKKKEVDLQDLPSKDPMSFKSITNLQIEIQNNSAAVAMVTINIKTEKESVIDTILDSKKTIGIIVGVVGGVIVILIIIIVCYCLRRVIRKKTNDKPAKAGQRQIERGAH